MFRTIAAIIIGAILLSSPKNAILYVVIAIGVLFIILGVISLISYFSSQRDKRSKVLLFLLTGIISVLFGITLVSAPHFFVSVLMYILGILLLLGGMEQVIALVRTQKRTPVSAGFYIIPLLIMLIGFIVLLNPFQTAETLFVIIGITCLIYGITECVNWLTFKRKLKKDTTDTTV